MVQPYKAGPKAGEGPGDALELGRFGEYLLRRILGGVPLLGVALRALQGV